MTTANASRDLIDRDQTETRSGTLNFSLSTWVDDDEWLKRYVDASPRNFLDDDESKDDRNLRRIVGFVHRDRNDVNATTIRRRKLQTGSRSLDDIVGE